MSEIDKNALKKKDLKMLLKKKKDRTDEKPQEKVSKKARKRMRKKKNKTSENGNGDNKGKPAQTKENEGKVEQPVQKKEQGLFNNQKPEITLSKPISFGQTPLGTINIAKPEGNKSIFGSSGSIFGNPLPSKPLFQPGQSLFNNITPINTAAKEEEQEEEEEQIEEQAENLPNEPKPEENQPEPVEQPESQDFPFEGEPEEEESKPEEPTAQPLTPVFGDHSPIKPTEEQPKEESLSESPIKPQEEQPSATQAINQAEEQIEEQASANQAEEQAEESSEQEEEKDTGEAPKQARLTFDQAKKEIEDFSREIADIEESYLKTYNIDMNEYNFEDLFSLSQKIKAVESFFSGEEFCSLYEKANS